MKWLSPWWSLLLKGTMVRNEIWLKYVGTIFAYGQTGCGKTHTMIGKLDEEGERGVMPNSFQHLFSAILSENHKGK